MGKIYTVWTWVMHMHMHWPWRAGVGTYLPGLKGHCRDIYTPNIEGGQGSLMRKILTVGISINTSVYIAAPIRVTE